MVPVQEEHSSSTVAAVDLGSNSFHLLVARLHDGEIITVDRMKETVRLASGLDDRNRLSGESMARALACLERFGQRLREVPPGRVRALGTNALRRARGVRDFLEAAQQALGHPVEIIGGHEEARLIYLGVIHTLSDLDRRRLVIDIGGGSTELIIGVQLEPRLMESLQMGCVTFTQQFFQDGRMTAARFRKAELAAQLQLQPIVATYRDLGWEEVLGSSGTLLGLERMLLEGSLGKDPGVTLADLEALRTRMVDCGQLERLQMPGLNEDRRAVIPGGLAIAIGIFKALGIDRLTTASGALREGVVHDLFGRFQHADVRERTIHHLCKRFAVEAAHAGRVVQEAHALFDAVAVAWSLPEEARALLGWAAELHEIGLALSHSRYHRHGEYILTWADLPGFSRQEQADLALLVRLHRRRLQEKHFEKWSKGARKKMLRLVILLRLAVLLHRSRTADPVPLIRLTAVQETLTLEFPTGWLANHPLTVADLELEMEQLAAVGVTLSAL